MAFRHKDHANVVRSSLSGHQSIFKVADTADFYLYL